MILMLCGIVRSTVDFKVPNVNEFRGNKRMPMRVYNTAKNSEFLKCSEYGGDCQQCALLGCTPDPIHKTCRDSKEVIDSGRLRRTNFPTVKAFFAAAKICASHID